MKILLVTVATEFVHLSTNCLIQTFQSLCESQKYSLTVCQTLEYVKREFCSPRHLLQSYDIIVFAHNSGDFLDPQQYQAFESFLSHPGYPRGFLAIHSASDALRSYPSYEAILGARFHNHPASQRGKVVFDTQAITKIIRVDVPLEWEVHEEFYTFNRNVATDALHSGLSNTTIHNIHILATVDESSYDIQLKDLNQKHPEPFSMGNLHPIVWCHELGYELGYESSHRSNQPSDNECKTSVSLNHGNPKTHKSRVFYCGLGHFEHTFNHPTMQTLISGALKWLSFERVETMKTVEILDSATEMSMSLRKRVWPSNIVQVSMPVAPQPHLHDRSQICILQAEQLKQLGPLVHQIISATSKQSVHFVISDQSVSKLYSKTLRDLFASHGFHKMKLIVTPDGETSKSFQVFKDVLNAILDAKPDKHTTIITLGGGVVNNLGGFVASVVFRGLRLVHIATSLLAQVDAAVCSKQAINTRQGKNQIGTLYTPSMVIMDTPVLQTLPLKHIINGLGEAIKHALCQDTDFLNFFQQHSVQDCGNLDFLHQVVVRCAKLKLELMDMDKLSVQIHSHQKQVTFDYADAIMQYGHSIGHAVEHLSNYELLHGEAVSIGMCVSCEISLLLGYCHPTLLTTHYQLLQQYQLPVLVPEWISNQAIRETLQHDKLFCHQQTHMMLLTDVSKPYVYENNVYQEIHWNIIEQALQMNRQRATELAVHTQHGSSRVRSSIIHSTDSSFKTPTDSVIRSAL